MSLLEDHELTELKIVGLNKSASDIGINVRRFPIADGSVPHSVAATRELVALILDDLTNNRIVVVHCKGGLGRTGLIVACVLVQLGVSAADAMTEVRKARLGAIENNDQERFICEFANVT